MVNYTITRSDEFSGATVLFSDGTPRPIASDNPNFEKVRDALLNDTLSEDELLELIAPFEAVYKTLTKLSERVSRKGNKLLFDGDPVNNALSKHIIEIMNEGGNDESWRAYVAFMERLYTNPSLESREHLFAFIENNGLLVTPDGYLVAYKSTKQDGRSTYAGYGIVDGKEYENDYLPNYVGAVVEIPRSMVDANRGVACSVGLHVGAYSYASTYSERLWTVIVDPRDVVSVPSDHSDAKIRVARYQIVEENVDRVQYPGTVKSFDLPVVEEPEVEDEPTPEETVVAAVVQKAAAGDGSRVAEYEQVIRDLIARDPNVSLRRYRSKRVTAARRDEFKQAANNLGFKL